MTENNTVRYLGRRVGPRWTQATFVPIAIGIMLACMGSTAIVIIAGAVLIVIGFVLFFTYTRRT